MTDHSQNEAMNKAIDFAGFAVFVAAIVAGKDTVKEFAGWSRKAVLYGLKDRKSVV